MQYSQNTGNQMRTIILNFHFAFTRPLEVITGCEVCFGLGVFWGFFYYDK